MPVNTPSPILPFYFGSADKRLFGCYHEPRGTKSRKCAVVICQPMGHEYIYCHRALRQLAARLCEAGFPVLRFDFSGCGDSSGEAEDGTLARWLHDTCLAVTEIKNKTGVARVCLIGIRLGAALAFAAAAECNDVDSIVLWDPVVLGRTYLEGLSRLQSDALQRRRTPIRKRPGGPVEVIGFPLPPALVSELEELDLLTVVPKPGSQILQIQSDQSENEWSLKHRLMSHGTRFEYQQVQAPKVWQPTVDGNLLVPVQVLRSIVSWTSRTQA
jgi:exosortase A-associated hydrolase 2